MASELRVNTINSRTGFGTITVSETGQDLVGITTIENLTAENTLVGAAASFTGNVSVGGVLTYEDVTNIDSVGLITARQGIEIGARPGVAASVSVDGNAIFSGITTVGSLKLGGSTITTLGAANLILSADSGGVVNVSDSFDCDGTATFDGDVSIADKIIHTGDVDTAIRFSGADTVSVETGGTERLSVSSAGLVSIPSTGNLQVGGAGSGETDSKIYVANTGGNAYIQIKGADSSGIAGLKFGRNSVAVRAGIDWSASTDSLVFRTGGTDDRLSIESNGQVNIGGAAVSQNRSLNIGSNAEANLAIETHNNATSETSNIRFYKSGNTGASPEVVETNDNIAQIQAYGYDGTDYACSAGSIKFSVDGAPGSNDMPGKITFSTTADGATSPTARLTIKNDGKIGINDTTPGAYLDIAQGGIDSDVPAINISMTGVGGGTVGPQYGIKITGGGYNNADHIYGIYVDKTAQLSQQNTAAHFKMSGTYSTLYGTQSIIQVNDTGATGTAYGLYASARGNSGSAKNKVGYGAWIESTGTNFNLCNAARLKTVAGSTLIYGIIYQHDSTEVFRISANGDVWSATNSYSSDRDLKENIVNLSGNSLDKIKQLTPRQFNWKLDDRHAEIDSALTAPTNTLTGLIAQEVKPILPDIVSGTDGQKDMGINYNGLVAHLVNAVKELSAENAAMRARLDALESA